jgi:hypothetical protein
VEVVAEDFVVDGPDDADERSPLSEAFPFVSAVALSLPASDPPSESDSFDFDAVLARRSFFAQPDPLNTIVGGANALRIGPDPHSGHDGGGSASTPWMTSNRRPHAEQS